MGHFDSGIIAERYVHHRPAVHDQVISALLTDLPASCGRQLAVDVGCGTGQSARPLADHFAHVHAYDISEAMLAEAGSYPHVRYRLVPAENLPDWDGCADLVISGLAFHWFDQERFLQEAWRILHPGGVLAVYNCWLAGPTVAHAPLRHWFLSDYIDRFPPPPRGGHGLLAALDYAHPPPMHPGGSIDHHLDVSFSPHGLARYLTTQSNITHALDLGAELDRIDAWLEAELERLFHRGPMELPYRARTEWAVKPTTPTQ